MDKFKTEILIELEKLNTLLWFAMVGFLINVIGFIINFAILQSITNMLK